MKERWVAFFTIKVSVGNRAQSVSAFFLHRKRR